MRLYIETMNEVVVECDAEGRVRFASGEWAKPSVQERRAIIHAAQSELEQLKELLETIERKGA
jgi:acyl-CoA reductase-like NAD-dependent aldehyde dehydrogenase